MFTKIMLQGYTNTMKSGLSTKAGFTLIELAVVISIIGLLSSILLVSLKNTRAKAQTARVISEAIQLRNQFEQGYDGTSYTDFTQYAPSDLPNEYIAPNSFSGTVGAANINSLISDIIALNGGAYAGGVANTGDATCGQSQPVSTYNASNDTTIKYTALNNGITIFVAPACKPVTSYAIFVSLAPVLVSVSNDSLIKTAYAAAGLPAITPNTFTGFFCTDSSGHSEVIPNSFIPGYTGTAQTYNVNKITNGQCP